MMAIFNASSMERLCAPNVLNPASRARDAYSSLAALRRVGLKSGLELIVHTRREADFVTTAPRRIPGAAVVDDLRIRAIVTVRREPAPSRAEIVVRIAFVDGIRRVDIPVNVLVEAVLPRNGVHVRRIIAVRRIVIALAGRISRSRSGMAPAHADVILDRKILRQGEP